LRCLPCRNVPSAAETDPSVPTLERRQSLHSALRSGGDERPQGSFANAPTGIDHCNSAIGRLARPWSESLRQASSCAPEFVENPALKCVDSATKVTNLSLGPLRERLDKHRSLIAIDSYRYIAFSGGAGVNGSRYRMPLHASSSLPHVQPIPPLIPPAERTGPVPKWGRFWDARNGADRWRIQPVDATH
jgi:hypothetical protein